MDKLNSKHMLFLIAGVSIVSLKTYPTILTLSGGRDTWIAVIIACILLFAFAAFVLGACRRTGEYVLYAAYRQAFGKVLGTVLIAGYLLTLLLTIFESSSVESNALKTNFFIERQVWSYMIVSVIAVVFVTRKGLNPIVITTIITITLITFVGIFLATLTQKYKELKYLFPIFGEGIPAGFGGAILKALGSMGCLSILLPLLPLVADKGKLRKNTLWALAYVAQMEIFAIVGAITTFGIDRMNELIYPKLIQTQLISYFGFLEFGELFVMLQIVAGWFIKFTWSVYAFTLLVKQMGYNKKGTEIKLAILAYGVGLYIADQQYLLFRSLNILLYVQLVNFVIVPALAYALLLIRRRKSGAAGTVTGQST